MKQKFIIIINPAAGKGKARFLIEKIRHLFAIKGVDFELKITFSSGDALRYAAAYNNEHTTLVVAGGDGTLNEVVNSGIEDFKFTLGVLPLGSGNDFVKDLETNGDLEKAVDIIVKPNKVEKISLGQIKAKEKFSTEELTSYFICSCGIGFNALVAHYSNKATMLKGLPLYLASVLRALIRYKKLDTFAQFDDKVYEGGKLLIAIGNARYSGGGFKLNPDADITRNDLDACIVDYLSKTSILRKLPLAIKGEHTKLKEAVFTKFHKASLLIYNEAIVHIDGEILSKRASEIKIMSVPEKLKVITA